MQTTRVDDALEIIKAVEILKRKLRRCSVRLNCIVRLVIVNMGKSTFHRAGNFQGVFEAFRVIDSMVGAVEYHALSRLTQCRLRERANPKRTTYVQQSSNSFYVTAKYMHRLLTVIGRYLGKRRVKIDARCFNRRSLVCTQLTTVGPYEAM
jgi:hypothetical protein